MSTTLLWHGHVYSPADPFATAMLVNDGVVAWVGADGAASVHVDDVDEVVELDGALVTPAFVDAHVHLTATGLTLLGLDLSQTRSLGEALDAVAAATRAEQGGVLLGHGWDETRWPERRPPLRQELDRAAGGAVVYLSRVDVHSCVASSALLAAVPSLPALPGYDDSGWLRRDAHHAARANAHASVTPWQRTAAQRAARSRAASLGIGAVHEMGGPQIAGADDFAAVMQLAADEPGPSVVGYWGELGAVERAVALGAAGAAGDLFVDGALGSRTAFLREPYSDDPEHASGARYLDADRVAEHVVACTRRGVQAGFHVIGDAAMDAVVSGFAAAADDVGEEALRHGRHRLEHVEMIDDVQVAALAAWGVVASVQPAFDAAWGGDAAMYAERLGVDRARRLNPFAAMSAAGLPLALGSDAPVTPLGPWEGVRAAAWHRTPEHRLSVRAAFHAHTRGGWRAGGDDESGVLVPGAPATYAVWRTGDLVVQTPDDRVAAWSTDPRSGVPGLPDLSPGEPLPQCLRTVVRGATVYDVTSSPAQPPEGVAA